MQHTTASRRTVLPVTPLFLSPSNYLELETDHRFKDACFRGRYVIEWVSIDTVNRPTSRPCSVTLNGCCRFSFCWKSARTDEMMPERRTATLPTAAGLDHVGTCESDPVIREIDYTIGSNFSNLSFQLLKLVFDITIQL